MKKVVAIFLLLCWCASAALAQTTPDPTPGTTRAARAAALRTLPAARDLDTWEPVPASDDLAGEFERQALGANFALPVFHPLQVHLQHQAFPVAAQLRPGTLQPPPYLLLGVYLS